VERSPHFQKNLDKFLEYSWVQNYYFYLVDEANNGNLSIKSTFSKVDCGCC
jgi:hypothetical protein